MKIKQKSLFLIDKNLICNDYFITVVISWEYPCHGTGCFHSSCHTITCLIFLVFNEKLKIVIIQVSLWSKKLHVV